jgi:hypothetical protein
MDSNDDNSNSRGAQGGISNQRPQQGQRSGYANPYHKKRKNNQRSAEQIKEFGSSGEDTRNAPRHKAGFRNEPSINKPSQPQPQGAGRPQQQGARPQQPQQMQRTQGDSIQGQSQPINANLNKTPNTAQQNTTAPRPANAGQPQRPQQANNSQRPQQNQSFQGAQRNPNIQSPQNVKPIRKWEDHKVKFEETYEDIKKENERIEKEIWLEIAEIHNAKLD